MHVHELSGNKKMDYIWAGGMSVARVVNGVTTYAHNDHLGSVAALTNSAGALSGPIEHFTPFGEALTPNAANDTLKRVAGQANFLSGGQKIRAKGPAGQAAFTGHIRDKATGLTYMQARYYDPVIGRFLSIDPVTFMDTGNPAMFNRYAYVENDPINMIDPDGLYGRGGDWSDEDWSKFDAAQQQASKDIGSALGTLDAAKNGDADAISAFQDTFGSDGDLNTRIGEVADTLTSIKGALDDTSEYMAYAEPNPGSNTAADGRLNGTDIGINTAHPNFVSGGTALQGTIIHEGGHNIGLTHPPSPTGMGYSKTPYRYGTNGQRKAFSNMKTLNPGGTFTNPDHVRSFVYP